MWWFEIGYFPHGIDTEEPEWMSQVVEWCTSYLAFCCDPPLLGYAIDGIATEEESAQGTSVSGEVPWGVALFYEEGMEEEAAHYVDKCLVAYHRFCTAVDWGACQPTQLLSLFTRLGYDAPLRHGRPVAPPGHAAPMALWNAALQEALHALEAAKNEDCTLELVRLPPLFQEHEPHWSDWVVTWIRAYVDYMCGVPPSGTRVTLNWESRTRWSNAHGTPAKVPCGWGLDWDGVEPPPKTRDFAEKFRLAFYRLLTHVDWQQFDGEQLRSCFDAQGYNDYLA